MSQIERWVFLKNGKLYLHTENDGYRAMRRGLEKIEEPVTLDDLKGTEFYEKAKQLLGIDP